MSIEMEMPSAMLPALAQASAALAIRAASLSREWISLRQALMASLITARSMLPLVCEDSDAPVAPEVEGKLSNLVAHSAPQRSQTNSAYGPRLPPAGSITNNTTIFENADCRHGGGTVLRSDVPPSGT